MSEAQTHFVAVCPHCSTRWNIPLVSLGQEVRCPFCNREFRAEETEADRPSTPNPDQDESGAQIQPWPQRDRVVVTCPSCQSQLKVRRVHVGLWVRCKQCNQKFQAVPTQADLPSSGGCDEGRAGSPIPSQPPSGPLVVTCPNCQSSLKVPGAFVGQYVRCNHCNQKFLASPPVESHPSRDVAEAGTVDKALQAAYDQVVSEYQRLQAVYDQLQAAHQQLRDQDGRLASESQQLLDEHEQLRAVYKRLKAERDRVNEQLNRVTTELESVRTELGGRAPAEVRARAEEWGALSTEIERLRQENQALRDEQAARDRRAGEREPQREAELEAAQTEVRRLAGLLEKRDEELEAASVVHNRLTADRQTAAAEVDRLRTTLADRERAIQEEGDQFRAEADRLQREFDQLRSQIAEFRRTRAVAEQTHRDESARLEAQLQQAGEAAQEVEAFRGDRDRLRTESDRLRVEADQLRSEIDELRRTRAVAEQTHRDERARLEAQLQQAGEAAQEVEAFRGDRDRLGTETDQLRAEGDRLRGEVEDLRRALDRAEQTGRDERARLDAELAGLSETHRRLQDQHESTQQLCKEYQERNEELRADLDRLPAAPPPLHEAGWSPEAGRTAVPTEALAGVAATTGRNGPSEALPAAPDSVSAAELEAARAQIEDLKRQLTEAERLQQNMAGILGGMGIRVRQV